MNSILQNRIMVAATQAFRGTPVFLAYAYGSQIWGAPRPDSDLDIGYYLHDSYEREDLPLYDQMLLEDIFTQAIGLSVDLRNLGAAPLELKGRALEEGVRIYFDAESARVTLETALLARYHDYKPKLAAMHEERLRSFAGRV